MTFASAVDGDDIKAMVMARSEIEMSFFIQSPFMVYFQV
jgi:hypothetical protein